MNDMQKGQRDFAALFLFLQSEIGSKEKSGKNTAFRKF